MAASEYMYGFFYAHPVHAGSCVVTHSFDWSRYLLSINCTSLERGEWRLAKCYGCHVLHIVCMLSRAWRGASQAHDQRTCFMKLSHRLYCAICMSLDNVGGTIATLSFLVWSEVKRLSKSKVKRLLSLIYPSDYTVLQPCWSHCNSKQRKYRTTIKFEHTDTPREQLAHKFSNLCFNLLHVFISSWFLPSLWPCSELTISVLFLAQQNTSHLSHKLSPTIKPRPPTLITIIHLTILYSFIALTLLHCHVRGLQLLIYNTVIVIDNNSPV